MITEKAAMDGAWMSAMVGFGAGVNWLLGAPPTEPWKTLCSFAVGLLFGAGVLALLACVARRTDRQAVRRRLGGKEG